MLTNGVISFEQLDPVSVLFSQSFHFMPVDSSVSLQGIGSVQTTGMPGWPQSLLFAYAISTCCILQCQ